jgi:organic anion transporter 3A
MKAEEVEGIKLDLVNENNTNMNSEIDKTIKEESTAYTSDSSTRTIKLFTFFICLAVLLTNALAVGYRSSVITTIEKCYEFSSSITGIFSGMLEIGSLIATLIISYFCAKSHIPKCIALSAVVCSLGSFLYALPHFVSDSYTINNKINNKTTNDLLCKINHSKLDLSVLNDNKRLKSPLDFNIKEECLLKPTHFTQFVLIAFANVLIGTSSAPLYTLGTTYIDNHVSKENSSVYLGTF